MRHGFVVPFAPETAFVELARLGEQAGWDGVFTWEGVWRQHAWVQLGAAAAVTNRVRLGTVITPVSRYRPWDLASAVGSVDRLSAGRVTLGVGLGALNSNWVAFEGSSSRAERAALVDEGLELYAKLCSGQPFRHEGRQYSVDLTGCIEPGGPAPTVQQPHPPVWCVGALVPGRQRQPSLERAARWQGCFPAVQGSTQLDAAGLARVVEALSALRQGAGLPWDGYDVVVEGDSYEPAADGAPLDGDGAPLTAARADELGATWWVESWWGVPGTPEGLDELRRRVAAGPRR